MNRRDIWLIAGLPALGLGLYWFSKREMVGPFVDENPPPERIVPENWRHMLESQMADTARRLEETREAIEHAATQARMRTAHTVESAMGKAGKATSTALVTAIATGALGALLVYVYAPEREQQQKLWRTSKEALASARDVAMGAWNMALQWRGSPRRDFPRARTASGYEELG